MTELTGVIAGICTTIAFLPQVVKTIRTNDTSSISVYMYIILVFGIVMWVVYGLLISSPSIWVANGVTFFLAGTVLVLKIRNLVIERRGKR